MPPAARIADPVIHPLPPVLTGGPPAVTVLIGGMPAWKGIPPFMGPALMSAQATSEAAIQVAETAAKVAEAAAVVAAPTPGGPAAATAATAARLAAETLKASSAAAMSATITAAASGGASLHACVTPWPVPPHGPGVVIDGSPTVVICNMAATRLGDTIIEAIGPPNKIAGGCPTVMIGNSGGGGAGGGGLAGALLGLVMAGLDILKGLLGIPKYPRTVMKNGKMVTEYNDHITIEGSPEYQAAVVRDLDRMAATESGRRTLDEFAKTGKNVTIKPIPAGGQFDNGFCDYANPADNVAGKGLPNADGTPGTGADGVITYNPSLTNEYTGADGKTYTQEPFEVLNHEMIHAVHQGQGNDRFGEKKPSPQDNVEEMQTIGTKDGTHDFTNDPVTEAALSKEQGDSPRPDHDSVTKSTFQDGNGVWHESKTDAAGNTTDTVIPAPPGGGPPSK